MTAREAADLLATSAAGYRHAEHSTARNLTRWERWVLKQVFNYPSVIRLISDRASAIALRKLANIIDSRCDYELDDLTPVRATFTG